MGKKIKNLKQLAERIKKEKPFKAEETEECLHQHLEKLTGIWYQCKACKQIFFFFGAASWKKEMLETEIKDIIKLSK